MGWVGHPKPDELGRQQLRTSTEGSNQPQPPRQGAQHSAGCGARVTNVQPSLVPMNSGPGGAGATWLGVVICICVVMNRQRLQTDAHRCADVFYLAQRVLLLLLLLLLLHFINCTTPTFSHLGISKVGMHLKIAGNLQLKLAVVFLT